MQILCVFPGRCFPAGLQYILNACSELNPTVRMTLHLGRTVLNAAPPPAQQVCIVNGRPLQYCWEMGVQFGCMTSYQGGMFKS
ncbi:hypothetical protein HHUSO_G25014 [Huso huso]|uniref:Uncharacterized protein n=1 Tax=Huso huso TaxID=61971 RepID=A0ABR0YSR8_HUSHU